MSILTHPLKKPHKLTIFLPLLTMLLSCGGTGQDEGQASVQPQILNGVAIDGYLARAMVFVDYDNNKTRDPWEPYAFTDDEGYFSFNPLTNINYCAASATTDQQLFCLRTSRALDEAVIRIDGGYDVTTGEPFYGQISRRVHPEPTQTFVISPLTSLLTDIHSEEQTAAILTALNLDKRDLDVDYLNTDNSGGVSSALLRSALRLHKSVSIISQTISEHYGELGSQPGSMNDITALVYQHLASRLGEGTHDLEELLANSAGVEELVVRAEQQIHDYYNQWEIPLPSGNVSASNTDSAALADRLSAIDALIGSLLSQTENDIDGTAGAIKLIEAMVIKASNTSSRATLRNSVNYLLNQNNQAIVSQLLQSLARQDSDITAISMLDLGNSNLNDPDAVRAIATLPEGTNEFRDLSGLQLRVSDMDLGSAPNRLRDSEIELYFHGSLGDTSGRFDACVKYIKDANINGKLGDANTRGELVKGHWSLLGANQNGGSSYSLLLTIEFIGTKYQAILKPAASAQFDGELHRGLRFDYGNELRTWYTKSGFEPTKTLPLNAADCASRLPSRIGI